MHRSYSHNVSATTRKPRTDTYARSNAQAAEERLQTLERELAEAEDEDRIALGDSLVDGRKPPASEAEKLRAALEKARAEQEALMYACERAGHELDRMPQERRTDWLPKAQRDFQAARAVYEQLLAQLTEARERLAEEAELVSFLIDGQAAAVRMAPRLRVHARGVEGLSSEVVVEDVLVALRDELSVLELDALLMRPNMRGDRTNGDPEPDHAATDDAVPIEHTTEAWRGRPDLTLFPRGQRPGRRLACRLAVSSFWMVMLHPRRPCGVRSWQRRRRANWQQARGCRSRKWRVRRPSALRSRKRRRPEASTEVSS